MPYTRSISIVREPTQKYVSLQHTPNLMYKYKPHGFTKKNEGLLLLAISFMVFSMTVIFYPWVKVAKLN